MEDLFLCMFSLGNIPETPDPSDISFACSLRQRVSLKEPSILKFQHIVTLCIRLRIQLPYLAEKYLRVLQLITYMCQRLIIIPGCYNGFRDAPHIYKLLIKANHFPVIVYNKDAVGS